VSPIIQSLDDNIGVQGTKSLAGVRGVPASPSALPPQAAREKGPE